MANEVEADMKTDGDRTPAIRPCAMAFAAMTVPARRWDTRTDLVLQLAKAEALLRGASAGPASIRGAAQAAGLSLHHFDRLFHEVYGVTPRDFLAEWRLQHAERLLRDTAISVLEIGAEVGFTNASAFSRFFRVRRGCSPTEYRARARAEQT